ncbi:MAG: ABC transporter permease [Solirubrobacterales bacterium]|nr:ABC transporter permease [Solirubrobacterales bacterium]
MSPGAVLRAVRGGIGRRRGVQTVVIALVLVVSTASSVLGLALLADSHATFDRAFSAQRGAHVVATIDTSRASTTRLAATAHLPQVSAAAGPFAETNVTATDSSPGAPVIDLPPLTLAGRPAPGGPVDDITLQDGRWPQRPGQVVMESNTDGFGVGIGDTVSVTSAPGRPRLTVVGLATSVSRSADGWVVPTEISALRSREAPAIAQMLYRFHSAGTAGAVSAATAAVRNALPAGAMTDTQSYLNVRAAQSNQVAVYAPFVVAFAIIGLVMSVLIVTNVVSGAVIAGYNRIGILKSIGFTPGQVVAAYTAQVLVPAMVGCLGGVALGNLLSVPLLRKTSDVYGVGQLGVPLWVNLGVPLAMCALVAVAAILPALRAGRLSATEALAAGRAPRTGRGYLAHRLLGRLALPRPATIGLASPFARPARMAATLAAVLLGVTAVTFAVGLVTSLRRAVADLDLTKTEQVQVFLNGPGPVPVKGPGQAPPSAPQSGQVITAALRSQPGTAHYVLEEDGQYVKVAGLVQPLAVTAFVGDARWTGYALSSGHWYTGPDQAVVPKRVLTTLHISVGDTVTITGTGGRTVPVRIVGEVFYQDHDGMTMLTDWRTLTAADPGLRPDPLNFQYDVGLRPGTDPTAYVRALGPKLGSGYGVSINRSGGAEIAIALAGTLTLLLSIAAALGVLNTVVLHTRERVHDLGVFRAVGMTPRQTVAMVLCSVTGTGLLAGVLAVPAGMVVHRYVIPAMAGAAGLGVPPGLLNVYGAVELLALVLAGLVIAVAGALLPAGWAAQARTVSALRAE